MSFAVPSSRASVIAAAASSAVEPSLYSRLSGLLGLTVPVVSEVDLAQRIEQGLPVDAVQSLRAQLSLTDAETATLVAPRRTLHRRASGEQVLSSQEADRAIRVARVTARAQEVFVAMPAYVSEWLRTANPQLAQHTPLAMLTTESGARAVEELLLGLDHGIFA